MKKIITAIALTTALVLTGCSNTGSDKTAERCEEDQPCWDCETMGNKVCGPQRPLFVKVPDTSRPPWK